MGLHSSTPDIAFYSVRITWASPALAGFSLDEFGNAQQQVAVGLGSGRTAQ
jgi:hypothetical protein